MTGDDMPITELKSGQVCRVNQSRTILADCLDCPRKFGSTGTAASHARSSRHRVEIDYRAAFAFVPIELIDGLVR